ncbi:MAG TPA: septum formation initiator family protein [Magnetospirillaceae bacterium]
MKIATEIRRRLRQVIGPLLGLSAIAYFAYHTVEGDRGLLAWWQLNRDIHTAELTLADLQTEQTALDQRAGLLRRDHLDPDMLEERARAMADEGHPDEVIILRPTQPK